MQPAVVAVGVDDADGLQIGVDDGGAHEGHAPLFQVLGNGVGQRAGGNGGVIFVDDFPACPAPNIGVKTAVFFLNVPEDAAVLTPIFGAGQAGKSSTKMTPPLPPARCPTPFPRT